MCCFVEPSRIAELVMQDEQRLALACSHNRELDSGKRNFALAPF
jgi:hypothetical protein